MTGPSSSRPSSGPSRPGWRSGLVLAVVLALVAGGCGWWEEGSPTPTTLPGEDPIQRERVSIADLGPFDLVRSHLAGPGTPLGGGLVVPEGAMLSGIPFSDLDGGGGFRALMVVVGDPVVTYNAMVSQALALGMVRNGICVNGPQAITCGGHLRDPADGESLSIEVRRSTNDLAVASGLAVSYRPPGSEDVGPGSGSDDAAVTPTAPLDPVELPPTVLPPPDGDVGLALRPPEAPVRHVEVGSELVGLAGPCACDGSGWSFVVAVEGRVRDVIAAYARQFSDLGERPDVSDRYGEGHTTFHLVVGEEGGPSAEIRAVAPDEGQTYLMVTVVGA